MSTSTGASMADLVKDSNTNLYLGILNAVTNNVEDLIHEAERLHSANIGEEAFEIHLQLAYFDGRGDITPLVHSGPREFCESLNGWWGNWEVDMNNVREHTGRWIAENLMLSAIADYNERLMEAINGD